LYPEESSNASCQVSAPGVCGKSTLTKIWRHHCLRTRVLDLTSVGNIGAFDICSRGVKASNRDGWSPMRILSLLTPPCRSGKANVRTYVGPQQRGLDLFLQRSKFVAKRWLRIYGRSLSSYSLGTSSCGTSCVVTSASSGSGAFSTPRMIPASNACPSSSNSSPLSESAAATVEIPS